ncbi:MAG: DUF2490 domain-containing protein [Bacteroidetes bacterium]|nr:DUF2490 domain-containing protein [Bacteroidota bacterium]HET6243742.1 DUF2490 domain-containing protein [Bacteroidia bacterium]
MNPSFSFATIVSISFSYFWGSAEKEKESLRSLKLLLFLILLNSYSVISQTYSHNTFRGATSIEKNISAKKAITLEYQHRRQSNLSNESLNIFSNLYLQSLRVGLRHTQEDRYEFIVNPISYFRKWPLLGKPEDIAIPVRNELRFAVQGELLKRIEKCRFQLRGGYEYRLFFQKNDLIQRGRARSRIQFQYRFMENLGLNLYDEVFFETWPSKNQLTFGENRSGTSLVFRRGNFRVEGGYVFIYTSRNSLERDLEHGLVVSFALLL